VLLVHNHEPEVPERREELTTEGGLDVVRNFSVIERAVGALSESGIAVSLFVDPVLTQIDAAHKTRAGIIELHTGAYANAQSTDSRLKELENQQRAAEYAASLGLHVNAGHGLTIDNVGPIARIPHMEELNIGHSIVARSIFVGMKKAVSEMYDLIRKR
jgi:pyridoxine 5-phosphate synthase